MPLFLCLLAIDLALLGYALIALPSRELRKEREYYPWRFNIHPFGSKRYISQQKANDVLEDIHHLYYNIYIPCKHRAEKLIRENQNSDFYREYMKFISFDKDLLNFTPRRRFNNLKKEREMRSLKSVAIVGGVGSIVMAGAMVAFTTSMVRKGLWDQMGGTIEIDKYGRATRLY